MSAVSSRPVCLLYTSRRKMENFEEMNASKDNLLEPPSINDSTTDEEDVKATIKPRLSPLPRRRSSASSDDGDLEPPPTVARKVSFADAFGFDLVSVKEFDTWEIPTVMPNFVMESIKIEEFYLTPSFILPPVTGIMERLHAKNVTLESVDFIPGTSAMKGIIRVLNISFEKQVYVRMSLDNWQSHYDLLAEYVPNSCDGKTDQFCFTISLVSPYQQEGAQVEFCLCYETSVGTFWDNNDGQNYVLTCQKKEKVIEISKDSDEVIDKNKKSCLKPSLSKEDEDSDVFHEETSAATEKYIPRIICSHDDFSEDNNDEETEDRSKEKNNEDESEVQLFLSQRLMNARITSSEEKHSTGYIEKDSSNDQEENERMKYLKNTYSGISDYDLQQPEECDNSGEYLPITKGIPSKETKDFVGFLSRDDNSGHYTAPTSTQGCLEGGEETDLYIPDSELNEQEKISGVITDEISHEESCQWSSPEKKHEDSTNESCLNISETPRIVPTNTMQLTEIADVLDDNANPNYSHSGTLPYFSTHNTKRIKDEQSEKSKSETIENDTLLPATKEHTEEEHPMLFSQQEEFQNLSYKCKSSCSSVLEKENTEANEKVCSFTSSGDAYLVREGQVRDTGEDKATESTNLTPSVWKNTKYMDDNTEVSDGKQYITTGKEKELSDSDIIPASLSKQYYVTDQDRHWFQEQKKIQVTDDKDVVSGTDDHIDRAVHVVNDSGKESSVLDCSPSRAHTAAENVTQGTFHEWNAMLGSLPSEQTQGYKVVIAKITEEKGQSQNSTQDTQGSSKGSYIDIGSSKNIKAQQEIDEDTEEKDTFESGKNIKLTCKNIVSDEKGTVEILAEEAMLKTDNISSLSTDRNHGGAAYISRGQYELEHYDSRSDDLVGESVEENDIPVTEFSHGLISLGQEPHLSSEDGVETNRETLDFTDLSQLIITEDESIGNVLANIEEGYVGPSILITSEPDDEGDAPCPEAEQSSLEDLQQNLHDHPTCPDQQIQTDTMAAEPVNMGHVRSKVLCFIMFVVFAGLMYHFDFVVCFALYLFSLYWLYWEGGKNKNTVRKE
ncbi:protein phosphatase 1 regulatory subunit 3A [Leptodactylus fuscus]|uniref:protein phosphatase 1 regulatory subunit 3A n=1 Tax=Leptodactylus fuscus TaxID=238119 RepID=UPI003F4F15C1